MEWIERFICCGFESTTEKKHVEDCSLNHRLLHQQYAEHDFSSDHFFDLIQTAEIIESTFGKVEEVDGDVTFRQGALAKISK